MHWKDSSLHTVRMKRRTVRVDTAQTVVLDEADRMLDMWVLA